MSPSRNQNEFINNILQLVSESLGCEFQFGQHPQESQQLCERFRSENKLVCVTTVSDSNFIEIEFEISVESETFHLVGALESTDSEWIAKLIKLTANLVEKEITLARTSVFLEEYSAQISRDFEELVWTRDLAVHLQQSDIRVPLSKLVEEVFSSLLQTIQASQILVIQYSRPISRTSPIPRINSDSVQSFGTEVICGQTIHNMVSKIGEAARNKLVVNNHPQELKIPGLSSFILLPINNHDSEFGWILAVNRSHDSGSESNQESARHDLHQDEFGTFEAGILQSTSIALATQAKNTFLHGEEEELLIGIVRALINAVDAKDPDTRGHSDRVAKVARRLAQEIGFDNQSSEKVYLSGLLHDIGKIGISDNVLLKRGSLTDEEYEQLKLHPVIGYNVLKHLDRVSYVLPGVLYHHESYDGRGYPEGLVAEEIPLIARIIAVADAFDAMTSDRPYRKGMPISQAEERLRENRGPQWDPDVIEAFFSSTDDIYEICFASLQDASHFEKKTANFDFITNAVEMTH